MFYAHVDTFFPFFFINIAVDCTLFSRRSGRVSSGDLSNVSDKLDK